MSEVAFRAGFGLPRATSQRFVRATKNSNVFGQPRLNDVFFRLLREAQRPGSAARAAGPLQPTVGLGQLSIIRDVPLFHPSSWPGLIADEVSSLLVDSLAGIVQGGLISFS